MLEMSGPCVTLIYVYYIFKFHIDWVRDNKDLTKWQKPFTVSILSQNALALCRYPANTLRVFHAETNI